MTVQDVVRAPVSTRWVAVGESHRAVARDAGVEAASRALEHEGGKLLVVFGSCAFEPHELLKGIGACAEGIPVIGCSTRGEIATSGPGDAEVLVFALGGDGFSVATSAATAASGLREAGAAVAACASEVGDRQHRVLLMLTDGLAGDQREIVRGAYGVVGAEIPLVGGCAGADPTLGTTLQFHGEQVLSNAVVAATIGSDAPLGIGRHHGWRCVGEPMLVSTSEANRVLTLDDEPALDVYLRKLDAPKSATQDPAAFARFAVAHPLGLHRRSGEEVRAVTGADFADRSLQCAVEVPPGGLTWLMEGDYDSVLAATDVACTRALDQLKGLEPLGLLAFDCIARRAVLGGAGAEQEVASIARHAAGAPVAGFYTYGEIARTQGTGGFHNQTLVILAIA